MRHCKLFLKRLAGHRPYVLLGAFVVGMLLTPPDIISQILLAIPMWMLFEMGILFARIFGLEKQKDGEEDPDAESADALDSESKKTDSQNTDS